MLSQQDKTLMGILIAIVNGVEIEEIDAPLEAWIRNCLFILKQHTTNEETINLDTKMERKVFILLHAMSSSLWENKQLSI